MGNVGAAFLAWPRETSLITSTGAGARLEIKTPSKLTVLVSRLGLLQVARWPVTIRQWRSTCSARRRCVRTYGRTGCCGARDACIRRSPGPPGVLAVRGFMSSSTRAGASGGVLGRSGMVDAIPTTSVRAGPTCSTEARTKADGMARGDRMEPAWLDWTAEDAESGHFDACLIRP